MLDSAPMNKRQLLVGAVSTLIGGAEFALGNSAQAATSCPDGAQAVTANAVKTWRTYAESRFGQVHFTIAEPIAGSTKTPLVALHTSPISGAEFKIFQQSMARDRRVICPDTPGFGASDPPPKVPTISDYSGAIADALGKLGYGAQKKVDVIGTHTGAMIGIDLAVSHPTLVRKVIISSIVYFTDDAARAEMKSRTTGPQPVLTDPNFIPEVFRTSVIEGTKDLPPERRLEIFAERVRAGVKVWWGPEAVFAYDLAPHMKAITQPTLMLIVRDVLASNTREAAKLLPNATVVDIEARTHMNTWDLDPDLLACEIGNFLDRK